MPNPCGGHIPYALAQYYLTWPKKKKHHQKKPPPPQIFFYIIKKKPGGGGGILCTLWETAKMWS